MGNKKSQSLFLQKIKRRILRHAWLVRIGLAAAALTLLIGITAVIARPVLDIMAKILTGPRMITAFFSDPALVLDSNNKRVNLILLGIAGGEHQGAKLTDTMIFTSIDLVSGDMVMLSIPRDIWLDSLQAKVNTAYYYGEEKAPGGGFVLAKDAVYQITGQPIDYTILLDFTGFVGAVDLVGGIEVDIERSFVDQKYPIPGKENEECQGDPEYQCRYETLKFEKGIVHMDGETALKFVRSRNAEGEEGTDFARSARQQRVILAFKNRLLSTQVLLSPTKLWALKKTFSEHVKFDKDLSKEEIAGFANLFWRFVRGDNTLRTLTLETGTEENPGFLIVPPISQYNQWVLIPRAEDWQEFQSYLEQKLANRI